MEHQRVQGDSECNGTITASTLHRNRKHTSSTYRWQKGNSQQPPGLKRVQQVKAKADLQGTLKTDPVRIHLREGAVPHAVYTARRVPLPLLLKVQTELQRMEEQGVTVKETRPTDWCGPWSQG